MVDKELDDIFDTAAGSTDSVDALKNDKKDIKDIFQQAHDAPTEIDAAVQDQNAPSLGQTVMDKGINGITAGWSPALAGVGGALSQFATGDYGPQKGRDLASLKAAFSQMRDLQKQKLVNEQTAHPLASSLSELGGGLVPAIATSGMGTAGMTGLGAATGLGNSDADLVNQGLGASGAALKDTAIGGILGYGGAKIGQGLAKALNPDALETSASKMAQNVVGFNPRADIPTTFDSDTGRVLKQYGETKGIGLSSLNAGALPLTGGMEGVASANQNAITRNFQQLKPIIQQTQSKLEQNLPDNLQKAGNLGDKLSNYYYDFIDNLPNLNNKEALAEKVTNQFGRVQDLVNVDGNLPELMAAKKDLYQDAVAASKNIYKSVDPVAAESEATFLKGMANVVKRHTEDLASTVDPDAAQQIKGINQNISNLINMQTSAEKQLVSKSSNGFEDLINAPTKLVTGFTPTQLGGIGLARGMNAVSKVIDTPAGELVQKAVAPVTRTLINNPWQAATATTQGVSSALSGAGDFLFGQNAGAEDSVKNVTKTAGNLYNATDESLQNVAKQLKNQAGMGYTADYLKKALDDNDNDAKNRAIFLIMSTPQGRALVSPEKSK